MGKYSPSCFTLKHVYLQGKINHLFYLLDKQLLGIFKMERAALIKFGSYKNISSLRDQGVVYMNTLPYFRNIEDNDLRGDPFDSVSEIQRGTKGHVLIPSTGQKLQITSFDLRIGPESPEKINLFCMYALRPQHGTYPVSEEYYRFGAHALIIFNVPKFIDKIRAAIRYKKITGSSNLVEYIDNDHIGEAGPFKKLQKFSYQSEWRLMCENGPGEPRTLNIGPINDISVLVETININNEITITP